MVQLKEKLEFSEIVGIAIDFTNSSYHNNNYGRQPFCFTTVV